MFWYSESVSGPQIPKGKKYLKPIPVQMLHPDDRSRIASHPNFFEFLERHYQLRDDRAAEAISKGGRNLEGHGTELDDALRDAITSRVDRFISGYGKDEYYAMSPLIHRCDRRRVDPKYQEAFELGFVDADWAMRRPLLEVIIRFDDRSWVPVVAEAWRQQLSIDDDSRPSEFWTYAPNCFGALLKTPCREVLVEFNAIVAEMSRSRAEGIVRSIGSVASHSPQWVDLIEIEILEERDHDPAIVEFATKVHESMELHRKTKCGNSHPANARTRPPTEKEWMEQFEASLCERRKKQQGAEDRE